jgi:GTPase
MSPYSGRKPSEELEALETELARYSPALIGRSRLVAANKMDLSPPAEELEVLVEECRIRGLTLIEISALTGSGLPGLLGALEQMVNDARSCGPPAESRTVVFAATETEGVKVRRKGETYLISGRNVERMVQMTDWGNDEARTHLAAKLRRRGVDEALSRAGAATGAQVEIAGRIFEYIPEDGRQDGNSDD